MRCGAGWKGLFGNYLSELEAQPGGPSGWSHTTAGSKPIAGIDRPRGERPFPTLRVLGTDTAHLAPYPVPEAEHNLPLSDSHTLYDHFGRLTRDGALAYGYDKNGNRSTIEYAGGVSVTYGYDFADRQDGLTVTTPTETDKGVASGVSYLPSGPLSAVTLGNGVTEARSYDTRYAPDRFEVTAPFDRDWIYSTDLVGNVLSVTERQVCASAPLVLETHTATSQELYEWCTRIEAGNGFTVDTGGDVTFRAANGVVLNDGFSVLSGGRFVAETAPVTGTIEIDRSYTYQPEQYYLTSATGIGSEGGTLAWTYDRIGNRLTETRNGGAPDTYQYLANGGFGNTPVLDQVTLGLGGTRSYTWDAAGNLDQVAAGANLIDFTFDDAGRLAASARSAAGAQADFLYDGRSFLRRAEQTAGGTARVDPVYDSAGLLHVLERQASSTDPTERTYHLYLAGRPVAQLTIDVTGTEIWTYLTTDHLGTPVLATDAGANVLWDSGFEPFGTDYEQATSNSALAHGIFLRLPGQWDDGTWADATSGAGVYYNVHRWYSPATGSYSGPDPINLGRLLNLTSFTGLPLFTEYQLANLRIGNPKLESLYGYGAANPLGLTDPDGRVAPLVCALPPALAALGKAVAATAVVVSAAAAGVIANDWINENRDCDDCDDEPPSHCDDLLEVDQGVCAEFARRGDMRNYRACMSQAMTRYSECLRFGRPLSPLFPSPFSD